MNVECFKSFLVFVTLEVSFRFRHGIKSQGLAGIELRPHKTQVT